MTDRPIEDLKAGDSFRDTILHRADGSIGPYLVWHGWAIMEAFLAGTDYGRKTALEGLTRDDIEAPHSDGAGQTEKAR